MVKVDPKVLNFIEKNIQKLHGLENSSDVLMESDLLQQTSDVPDAMKTTVSEKIIPVAFAQTVALNLFEPVTMDTPTVQVPRAAFTKESTTAEVSEGGAISTTKVSFSMDTIIATKFAYRSVLTAEVLEDKNVINADVLQMAFEYDAKEIADQIDKKLIELMNAAASAGDVYWEIDIPADWSTTHPSMEYYDTLWQAVSSAVANIAKNKFRADFILMHIDQAFYITRLPQFNTIPDTSLQGELGRLGNLTVFSSVNVTPGVMYVGQKRIFGVYGVYVPMQYVGPVYDPQYDKKQYVVRTRVAMKVLQGEALARVLFVKQFTNESVAITDSAGQLINYPVDPTSISAEDSATEPVTATIVTWDSRFDDEPSPDTTEMVVDIETGAVKIGSGLTGPMKVTYKAVSRA